jgi:hypothetical protein
MKRHFSTLILYLDLAFLNKMLGINTRGDKRDTLIIASL